MVVPVPLLGGSTDSTEGNSQVVPVKVPKGHSNFFELLYSDGMCLSRFINPKRDLDRLGWGFYCDITALKSYEMLNSSEGDASVRHLRDGTVSESTFSWSNT